MAVAALVAAVGIVESVIVVAAATVADVISAAGVRLVVA